MDDVHNFYHQRLWEKSISLTCITFIVCLMTSPFYWISWQAVDLTFSRQAVSHDLRCHLFTVFGLSVMKEDRHDSPLGPWCDVQLFAGLHDIGVWRDDHRFWYVRVWWWYRGQLCRFSWWCRSWFWICELHCSLFPTSSLEVICMQRVDLISVTCLQGIC